MAIALAGAQIPCIEGLRQHVVDDPCSLRLPYQILLELGERKLFHELVHGSDGAVPGVEAGVGGGVVAQLDQEQHGEQGEREKAGDKPDKSKNPKLNISNICLKHTCCLS